MPWVAWHIYLTKGAIFERKKIYWTQISDWWLMRCVTAQSGNVDSILPWWGSRQFPSKGRYTCVRLNGVLEFHLWHWTLCSTLKETMMLLTPHHWPCALEVQTAEYWCYDLLWPVVINGDRHLTVLLKDCTMCLMWNAYNKRKYVKSVHWTFYSKFCATEWVKL